MTQMQAPDMQLPEGGAQDELAQFGMALEDDSPLFDDHGFISTFGDHEYTTDYRGRCGNCTARMNASDRYCAVCGTKRGEGAFRPYLNDLACIYGPMPVYRGHECTACHTRWYTCDMVDEDNYCANCGRPTPVLWESEEQPRDLTFRDGRRNDWRKKGRFPHASLLQELRTRGK